MTGTNEDLAEIRRLQKACLCEIEKRPTMMQLVMVAVIVFALVVMLLVTVFAFRQAAAECMPVTPAHVHVVDGDTIDALGERWRLTLDGDRAADPKGFDTPETFRPHCEAERALGKAATARLREMVAAGGLVLCAAGREDRYGRQLGALSAGGRNVGEVLLEKGLARRWPAKEREWCDE